MATISKKRDLHEQIIEAVDQAMENAFLQFASAATPEQLAKARARMAQLLEICELQAKESTTWIQ